MFFQNRFQNWDVPGSRNVSCVFYSTDVIRYTVTHSMR